MSVLRFAELFAGAGGLSLGLERAGWTCAWHSEIADAPRAILKHRWPDTPLLGDVTTLDGRALVAEHGPIDLLSGGSPCQDLSVAGKRAGLQGARSGLFYEQMRLWEETGADLCLWENVDGARSSNAGKDFGEVLRAFVGAPVPVPSDGWRSAGVAAGPAGVAAWRVLDAQYFGVPQRRRRVFVLGTRTGSVDPAEVLSLAESLRGDSSESGEAGEGAAASPHGRAGLAGWDRYGVNASGVDLSYQRPLPGELSDAYWDRMERHEREHGITPEMLSGGVTWGFQEIGKRTGKSTNDSQHGSGITDANDPMYTLQAGAQHGVLAIDLAQVTSKANRSQPQPLSPTLNGHGDVIAFDAKQDGDAGLGEISPTLTVGADGGPKWIGILAEVAHALTHEGADASVDGTGRGTPVVVGTLESRERGGGFPGTDGALAGHVVANAICAREAKGWEPESQVGNGTVTHGIPRRLMPIECERLMAWEDDHTLVPDAKGKLLSDAARYKAIGNGCAAVHSQWIGWRLALALGGGNG